MGRRKIEWFPGAIYHVTTRGNHRNDIFRDEEDYQVYLITLQEALERYTGILYCYCLITNHTHLMIETTEVTVSEIMRRLNLLYTKHFNKKYNLVGHLFQGRYYAESIQSDSHRLEGSKYIHLNPVRAKMVNLPEEYEWSSYSMLIGIKKEKKINSEKILSYFRGDSRLIYKEYVEGALISHCEYQVP